MTLKLLIVAPLALLAACGGSGTDDGNEPAAPENTSPAAAPESQTSDVPSAGETVAAASETPGPEATKSTPSAAAATATTQAAAATKPPAAFAQCRTCHSAEPGKNGVGPTLFGIVGSKAGEVPGYSFSPALAKSGIVWDRASLDTWLKAPMKMVPGTKMVIAQPDAAKRKEIIDYLETLK